jgi:hypothetical protein
MVKLLHIQDETDSEAFELGSDALLGHSNKFINKKRTESHKNDFDPKFFTLTSPSFHLQISCIEMKLALPRMSKTYMSRFGKVDSAPCGRGYRNFPYRRGGRSLSRGYRGRGFMPS